MTTRSGRSYRKMAEGQADLAGEDWQRAVDAQLAKIQQACGDTSDGLAPGIFKGREDENVRRWWQRYNAFADFRGWPAEKKTKGAGLYLAGEADRWYQGLTDAVKNDYAALEIAFMDRFGKCGPLWLYDQKLLQLKQLPNQTVEQYATLLKEKAEKAQKTDRELLSFFINGLRPEIKAFVAGKTPGDFAAAYVHAKTAEVVTKIPKEPEEISGGMKEIIGHLHGLEKDLKDMKNKAEDRERTFSRREFLFPP